jgi:hypothetical protein
MVIDTPQRSDSDLVKQQWLRAKIESELKRLHISQFSTTCTNHSFFQLVLACDDDGYYTEVDESKMVTQGTWEELYMVVFRCCPPYFTERDAVGFSV